MTAADNPVRLTGKNILIIGGTAGIGLSAARAFVAAGANVLALGLNTLEVSGVESESMHFIQGDATEPLTSEKSIGTLVRQYGRLDGLYHVAGGSGRKHGDGPLDEITDGGWNATLNWNLTSMFHSNRAAVRQFMRQKTGGSILNISSVLAWAPSPKHFATHAYAAAKSAVLGLTRACAAYYAPQGIRFNVIAPGLIATPMSRRAQSDEEIMKFVRARQPLDGGRIGQPSDLDAAAVFFMSDGSKFVTGQVLAVDGGWSVTADKEEDEAECK